MDGRDLSKELCSKWTPSMTIMDIANNLPNYIAKIKHSKIYNFYGAYHLGALYDLKNFSNMLVSMIIFYKK